MYTGAALITNFCVCVSDVSQITSKRHESSCWKLRRDCTVSADVFQHYGRMLTVSEAMVTKNLILA